MLLRRVTQHVKEQNWFAVALDFVIVVAGILIAFQITEWNEARVDNARIERRLDNITVDLRADIVEISEIVEIAQWRSAAIFAILTASDNAPVKQYEAADGEIFDVFQPSPFESQLTTTANNAITWLATLDGNQGAYEALISTGDLQIIEDQDLAREIQAYYAHAKEVYDQDRAHQFLRDLVEQSKHRLGAGVVSKITLDQLIEFARNDHQFAAELSSLFAYDVTQIQTMVALKTQAEALIDVIEETD